MRLNYESFTVETTAGTVELRFPGKPSEAIRTTLKRNGYRWSPSSQCWWSRSTRYADFVAALDRQIRGVTEARQPVGACWSCKDPNGHFRNRGAASPVLCDACYSKEQAPAVIDVDSLYEDQCREACGL